MECQSASGSLARFACRSAPCSVGSLVREDLPLGEVDWSARPAGCRVSAHRTKAGVEQRMSSSSGGNCEPRAIWVSTDPEAIQRELQQRGERVIPAVATIARILSRRGALDGRKRVRRKAPPPGWFLSDVSDKRAEMDNFDAIEDLVIRGGIDVNVLTGISLHGGLCAAWPAAQITAKVTVECLLEHWREVGLPRYAKFDNGTVFHGTHRWPDSLGRVTRMCLSLEVTPVFAAAAVPRISSRYRSLQPTLARRGLVALSTSVIVTRWWLNPTGFVDAHRRRYSVRIEDAPRSQTVPQELATELATAADRNRDLSSRETNAKGQAVVLGNTFNVSPVWIHRLVRADVDLTKGQIRFYCHCEGRILTIISSWPLTTMKRPPSVSESDLELLRVSQPGVREN